MTEDDKKKIKTAIKKLMADEGQGGDFTEGINILCQLVGWEYPAAKAPIKHVSLLEFIQQSKKRTSE